MSGRFFLFGLGFSGRVIARALMAAGWQVAGTTRSGEAADLPGVEVYAFDRDHPLPPGALAGVGAVLSAVPPDAHGDPVLDVAGAALRALPLRWAGYLSTTGVYGDRDGGWVTEESELRPTLDRSRRRVEAEAAWR
ncbi:MAG TPA: SDR family NAD(P)-dependent oxidoreductase, partial [Magnetospirillum sp.]|nr:SDR family NAD(P)-dependent oxidoreductase [Magnetospirillum sp.]